MIAFTVFLASCATSSGVQPIGKDLYSLTVQDSTASAAKQSAIQQATAHCASTKKDLSVTDMGGRSDAYGWHSYELNFRCI